MDTHIDTELVIVNSNMNWILNTKDIIVIEELRECTGQGVLQCDGYLVGRDRYTGDIVLWS